MNSFAWQPKGFVLITVIPTVLIWALLLYLRGLTGEIGIIGYVTALISSGGIVASILSFNGAFSKAVKLFNYFPFINLLDLTGDWVVISKSNWPVINAMRLGQNTIEGESYIEIEGILKLKANFFKITGTYEVITPSLSQTSRSDIIASSLSRQGSRYIFTFLAESEVDAYASETDSSRYNLAAKIHFDESCDRVASGTYWTDRNHRQGLNTAGVITITRK